MDFNEYIRQGSAFWQEGKINPALESFDAALKLQPNNTELQQMIEGMKIKAAKILEMQQKMSEACVNEAKSRASVMESLYGIKLEEITDVYKIIAEYSQAPKCNHASAKDILASAYYISGLLFDSKREYTEAVKAYSEAINSNPDYPLAFKRRGMANLELGKIENCNQAVEDFKKANLDDAILKQQLTNAYWKRAIAYDQKGDNAHVVEDCERLLELNPNNGNARELLNMAKDAMKK
jgi:tetratricopeptide (TPR) repeat protein